VFDDEEGLVSRTDHAGLCRLGYVIERVGEVVVAVKHQAGLSDMSAGRSQRAEERVRGVLS
jgi:hypothetical protein